MVLQIFLLIEVILLGIVTTATDLRHGKIYNKTIIAAIIAGLVFNLLQLQFASPFEFATNALFAFLAGFLFFAARLWSAADAKLFLAYALLVPSGIYVFGYIPLFPSLNILINAFVPVFIFLLVKLLVQSTKKEKLESLKNCFSLRNIAYLSAGVFGLGWVSESILSISGIPGNFFLSLFIIFALIELANWLVPKKMLIYLIALLCLGRIVLEFGEIASISFLLNFAISVASILLLFYFTLSLGFLKYGNKIKVKNLKEGDVLLEAIVSNEKGRVSKKDIFGRGIFSAMGSIKARLVVEAKPTGLDKDEIKKIKELEKQGKIGFDSILVQKSLAFAPILFFGVILTIVCRGNFIAFLVSLILKGL